MKLEPVPSETMDRPKHAKGGYQRHRSAFGHGMPTDLQTSTWALVEQTGSQTEAARILGCSQGAVQSSMRGYQHAMGLTGPLPGARVYRTGIKRGEGPWATLRGRVTELEAERDTLRAELDAIQQDHDAEVQRLTERIAALTLAAGPWTDVHRKLDAILARPTVMAAPTHRRQSDGGIGGKRERRGMAA